MLYLNMVLKNGRKKLHISKSMDEYYAPRIKRARRIGGGIQRQYKPDGSAAKSRAEDDDDHWTESHGKAKDDPAVKRLRYKSRFYKQYQGHTEPLEIMAQIQIKDRDGNYIRGRKGGVRVTVPCLVRMERLPKRIREAIEYHQNKKKKKKARLILEDLEEGEIIDSDPSDEEQVP